VRRASSAAVTAGLIRPPDAVYSGPWSVQSEAKMRRRRVTDGVPKSGQGSRIVSRETTVVAEAGSRPPAGEIVVETRNLSKVYRDFWGRSKKTALKPLDLDIRRGEIFGLLGPNGAGKTTTLKLLLGLIFPTSGEALVFGRPATDVSKNERIGYLPEESYLYKFLDAEETLDFYGRLFDMPPEERRRRADALIEMVGLSRDRKRQLREYSKGMTRRIGVAQALINDPELVILDEPTSGLDPIGTREMKDLIIDLKARGKTVIMCSHLLADVEDVCDRIAVLHLGELKELGRVEELLRVTGVTQFRASGLSPEAIADVRRALERHGAAGVEVGNPRTTLEDLFLEVVRDTQARPGRRARRADSGRAE
jgi:ABC-2 type transport system ATP-binding protein